MTDSKRPIAAAAARLPLLLLFAAAAATAAATAAAGGGSLAAAPPPPLHRRDRDALTPPGAFADAGGAPYLLLNGARTRSPALRGAALRTSVVVRVRRPTNSPAPLPHCPPAGRDVAVIQWRIREGCAAAACSARLRSAAHVPASATSGGGADAAHVAPAVAARRIDVGAAAAALPSICASESGSPAACAQQQQQHQRPLPVHTAAAGRAAPAAASDPMTMAIEDGGSSWLDASALQPGQALWLEARCGGGDGDSTPHADSCAPDVPLLMLSLNPDALAHASEAADGGDGGASTGASAAAAAVHAVSITVSPVPTPPPVAAAALGTPVCAPAAAAATGWRTWAARAGLAALLLGLLRARAL
jgi:hypothetical protein